jgi:aminoglycoside 6'-N-acetyltransferase I
MALTRAAGRPRVAALNVVQPANSRAAIHGAMDMDVVIRLGVPADIGRLSRLREALWPQSSYSEHARELASLFAGTRNGALPLTVYVAETADGDLIGFLEAGLRSHADGCDARQPVGFVEGWFVVNGHRRQGVGRRLLAAAETWARQHGCAEMASDTWIDHVVSQRVHEALNFEVVDRCVHYRKPL